MSSAPRNELQKFPAAVTRLWCMVHNRSVNVFIENWKKKSAVNIHEQDAVIERMLYLQSLSLHDEQHKDVSSESWEQP